MEVTKRDMIPKAKITSLHVPFSLTLEENAATRQTKMHAVKPVRNIGPTNAQVFRVSSSALNLAVPKYPQRTMAYHGRQKTQPNMRAMPRYASLVRARPNSRQAARS